MEDSLQHKKVYYLTFYPIKGVTTDSIRNETGTWYGGWISDLRTYQKVNFETTSYKITSSPGQKNVFNLTVANPYPFPINFSNQGYLHPVVLEACLFKGDNMIAVQKAGDNFNSIKLKPGESAHYTFTLIAPMEKGNFELLFSLRTDPFPGSKNSRIINFTVK